MRVTVTLPLLISVLSPAALAQQNIIIDYATPQSQEEHNIKVRLKQSGVNDTVIALSEQYFPFNQALTIQYGGQEGPMYDPQSHKVHIPYSFYSEALGHFTKNKYAERFGKPEREGVIDTILHTLLHEAGHAYIADQNIPVLGKEEDAVDNFAAVLMLHYVDGGADASISAADMFAFESEDRPDYYDFGEYIDEHSFDLQRYFSTLCLVYGSAPEKHQSLLDEIENDYLTERKEFCIYQFDAISSNWHHYFKQEQNTD